MRAKVYNIFIFSCFMIAFFFPVFFQGHVFSGRDLIDLIHPMTRYVADSIKLGEGLTFWNPYFFCGFPAIAEPQIGYFYPPNWLNLIMPTPVAYSLITILLKFLGALGFYRLMRMLKISRESSLLSATMFIFGTFMIARNHAGNQIVINTCMWTPWVLGRALKCYWRPRAGHCVQLALCVAMIILAGSPQFTFYTFLGTAILIATLWVAEIVARKKVPMKAVVWLSVALSVGVLISMIQILPTLEWKDFTHERGGLNRLGFILQGSLKPRLIWTFFFPDFFDHPVAGESYAMWGEGMGYHEYTLYLGIAGIVLPILFASLLLLKKIKNQNAKSDLAILLVCFAFVVLSIIFALGGKTIIYPLLAKYIPGFAWFRFPSRFLLWAHVAIPIAAGLSLDRLSKYFKGADATEKKDVLISLAIIAGCVLVLNLLLGNILGFLGKSMEAGTQHFTTPTSPLYILLIEARQSVMRSLLFACLALFPFVLLAWQSISVINARRVMLLFLFLDLFFLGKPFVQSIAYKNYESTFYPESKAIEYLQSNLGHTRFLCLDDVYAWNRTAHPALIPNRDMTKQIQNVRGYNPMYPGYLAEFLNAMAGLSLDKYTGAFISINQIKQPALLGYLNVSDVLSYDDNFHGQPKLNLGKQLFSYKSTFDRQDAVLRIPKAANRSDNSPLKIWEFSEFKAMYRNCWLSDFDESSLDGKTRVQPQGTVKLKKWSADLREYKIDANAGEAFVLSESFHPGWKCFVRDGFAFKELKVHRANHAFMAAIVPQGESVIQWRFQPDSVRTGAWLSILGILLAFVLLLVAFVQRWQTRQKSKARTNGPCNNAN